MHPPSYDIPGYELLRELGAGGMATVFLALQRSLERQVAIKVMRRSGADESLEKRFLLEGRTMAKLPHRNIVGVYDIVQTEAINYIAMEYLGGGTLSERLQDGLSLAEAIAIVVQIAGSLQFAHDNGVVHRDLKPANIMFRDRFTPVLTDFGIARQNDAAATRLTQTGMMIGTPTYMSPEQAMGEDVDGRSDQYSLGVLFFEMLTGAPPFGGETPLNVVLAHLHQAAPPLPPQFAHFQPVMDRLLAKKPEQRYGDLKHFVAELKSLLTHSDTLMARLRIDPNQSASEQLRALGFSESQINTGSGSSPAGLAAAAGSRSGHTTHASRGSSGTGSAGARFASPGSSGASASGPGVRLEPSARPVRRPSWILPAATGAVVLALLLAWLLLGRDALSPELRALVDTSLQSADRLIAEDKLVSPSGDNAYEKIQTVLQVSPGLAEAEQRLERIVAELRQRAARALAAGEFEVAETRIGEGLAVRAQDPELLALRQRLETARLDAARTAQVRALLERADAAERAGRPFGEDADTALGYLRQAAQLEPSSAPVRERLGRVHEAALQPVRTALAQSDLEAAQAGLDATAGFMASTEGWQQLQQEIASAVQRAELAQRTDALLATARRQQQQGQLAEPAGDNALETLARVGELDAQNPAAAELYRGIGAELAGQAAAAEAAGDAAGALALYGRALQAIPQDPRLLAARQQLETRLGERQAQISRALGMARDAIVQRRFLEPAGNNALAHLDAVLALDAGHAEARRLQAQIPALIRDSAEELAREQRIDAALGLLQRAQQQYPDDQRMALRASELLRERDRAQAAGVRAGHLAQVRDLLARRQLNGETTRGIGAALRALLDADPADAEALRYRATFLQGIARVIDSARSPATLEQIEPILIQVRAQLGGGDDIAALDREFSAATQRLQAAERERLAASSGVLVLNAQPWASIESVVEQASGTRVALPGDASTPLRLTVPAGTYRIAFRHPSAPDPVVLVGTVSARQADLVSARFPTLTAERFLRDAGWSP